MRAKEVSSMKKDYVSPELELFSVRPDEQVAVSCLFVNNQDTGYDCFYTGTGGGGYNPDRYVGVTGS